MTLTEKAVCEVYTGIVFCTGDERRAVYKYIAYLIGRPVYTHELRTEHMMDKLKRLAEKDFISVCKGEELEFNYSERLK